MRKTVTSLPRVNDQIRRVYENSSKDLEKSLRNWPVISKQESKKILQNIPQYDETAKIGSTRETFPAYAPILDNERGKRLAKLVDG